MIYLDNAATTKMYEGAVDVYKKYACQSFFNPSAGYNKAIAVSKDLDKVRQQILNKLGANGNIIFTSGATESNNLAIYGNKRNGKWEYVFSEGEHPSVYNIALDLQNQGFVVHIVKLMPNGQVDYDQLEKVVNEKTRIISVMHVSNETGAINDIPKIDHIRQKHCPKALLHVDGVQAFCKLDYNIWDANVDLYTISSHKFHGPKGVGALYVKNISPLKNIVFGGGQEGGYRSGTENVGGIMAMGYAIEHFKTKENYLYVSKLKDIMKFELEKDEKIKVFDVGSPYILSVSFTGVNGETLMRALQDEDIFVGIGSACSTKKAGNRVLESMGLSLNEIKSHIRLSFSEDLDEKQMHYAGKKIVEVYNKILEKVK